MEDWLFGLNQLKILIYFKCKRRGDTVFRDSIVFKYKDKIKNDSIFIRDTIRIPIPIKGDTVYISEVKWWYEASVWFTAIVLAVLALYLMIKYRSKIFSFFRKLIFKV